MLRTIEIIHHATSIRRLLSEIYEMERRPMKKAYKKKAALQLGLINMSGSHCCLKPYNWGLLVKKKNKKRYKITATGGTD